MRDKHNEDLSFDEFDELNHPRDEEPEFNRIARRALSRRGFLGGTVAFGAAAFVASAGLGLPRAARAAHGSAHANAWLPFEPIPTSTADTVTVPEGFNWHVVARWGDPLWSKGAEFDPATRGTGESQELSFGDNTDGMALFTRNGRSVLAINNEFCNRRVIHANRDGARPANADDIRKSKAAHGVTVMEVRNAGGHWGIVKDSYYNRRITADTPMDITGPARGHDLMKTAADPQGVRSLGTWNNCAHGETPWGTYLACEENFNGYYSSSDPDVKVSDAMKRYGVGPKDWGYAWAMADERFDISRHPNESNRNGFVVEIDPLDPTSTPKKRSAMGRFKHENAAIVIAGDGRVVAYMGDDERGEFLYRFISSGKYDELGDNSDLLEEGELFVAKFSDDGRGEWVALTPASTGLASQAEVCIHTRIGASAVGATTMDRPEWVAAHPMKAEVYCCLTNNKNRGIKTNAGGDETPVGGPNPREANLFGQIVRWRPQGGDHLADGFDWDLYVVAGNPAVFDDERAGSKNVTAENMFNSPDGLAFDSQGGLWIQTDGNFSNAKDFAGQGNNQMLLGNPDTGDIARFLVGPNECEVTGVTWSADRQTMFVGLQHPGYRGTGGSHFPDGGDSVPRSAIVAIQRDDGGRMG